MEPIRQGRLVARLAEGPGDVERALALRHEAFFRARGLVAGPGEDRDAFDDRCLHVLVESDGRLSACFRLLLMPDGRAAAASYSAQFYDLAPLAQLGGPVAELGRFCLRPGAPDPDLPRLAWAALARLVDAHEVGFLFGCASLPGADPARHGAALAALGRGHVGPDGLRPRPLAADRVSLPSAGKGDLAALPQLLRSYLALGGWVSDHAVIDRRLDTLHVFAGLEVAAVPEARARTLRRIGALAG